MGSLKDCGEHAVCLMVGMVYVSATTCLPFIQGLVLVYVSRSPAYGTASSPVYTPSESPVR